LSCRQRWQSDEWIVAHRGHGFQRHVAGALHGPFIVLFEQDGADKPGDGGFVGDPKGRAANMPTTSVRRLISPLSPAAGFMDAQLS
jgi:hypothetical protein